MALDLLKPGPEDADNKDELKTQAERDSDYTPKGFKGQIGFLTHAIDEFTLDSDADDVNRQQAADDLEFMAGEQWDKKVKAERQAQSRPCLTINNLPQFIGQVIGERKLNNASIRVIPIENGTKEVAQLRGDLIRAIEQRSKATRKYEKAMENQVTCGIGNLRVDLDFSDDDVFVQDLFINVIHNPLAVIWDRNSVEPTAADANHCFIIDEMSLKAFEKQFPNATPMSSFGGGEFYSKVQSRGWIDKDKVRVVEYWRIIRVPRKIALFTDGSVRDITDKPFNVFNIPVAVDAKGKPITRNVKKKVAQMHLITGLEVLEGPYELPLNRLPIVRVEGRIVETEDQRARFGLVRFAKDPQRLKNYWRSIAAEALAMAPKATWIAPSDAVEGREKAFREGHLSGDPLIVFNKNASAAPIRVPPPILPEALLVEAKQNSQDMKDVTGIHDAFLGLESNEVSGKAINARAQRGAVATSMYHTNLNYAIQEIGIILNQLIPLVYDTPRILLTIGENDKERSVLINDSANERSIDLTFGRYEVVITTGPSFTTKREEAATGMLTAVNAWPQLMAIAGDLIVKAQDWPMADELSKRLHKALPPELQDEEEEGQDPGIQKRLEEEALKGAQMQQAQELAASTTAIELEFKEKELEIMKLEFEVMKEQAQAREAEADANKAEAEAGGAAVNVGSNIAETLEKLSPKPEAGNGNLGTPSTPLSFPGTQPGRFERR